nr:reverse transcriptase domain-containing protein [Escherichia coli]
MAEGRICGQLEYHRSYSGTPQGGIISPLLANIYLDKLDRFVEQNFNSCIYKRYKTKSESRYEQAGP